MNVVCVSTCMLGWTFLYAWLCYMLPYKSCEWNCRLVTVIHAVFIMAVTGWSMFIQGPNPLVDPGMYDIYIFSSPHILSVRAIADVNFSERDSGTKQTKKRESTSACNKIHTKSVFLPPECATGVLQSLRSLHRFSPS